MTSRIRKSSVESALARALEEFEANDDCGFISVPVALANRTVKLMELRSGRLFDTQTEERIREQVLSKLL